MFVLLTIFLFMGFPLAFVLGGVGVIFGMFALGTTFFGTFASRIYGIMDNFILVAVTLFIFMGNLLTLSGVADRLFRSLRYLFGPLSGGLGLAVITVSIIFAACTGIIGASVVTMGLLGGPLLIKYGYQKELTTGIICAGGSLGVLIPPSIMLVIMGDQASISVGKLLLAAVIPGVSLGLLYMGYVLIRCWINPELGPPIPKEELDKVPISQRIRDSFIYALPPIALIIIVLGSIFLGLATPTEASAMGSFASFIMLLCYRRFTWESFMDALSSTARATTMVFFILIGASCFTGVFIGLGGGTALVNAIIMMGLGKWGTYSLMMAILIVMGMFLDWIGIVMIVFPIFIPIAKALGFDMIWFVTIIAINLQISFLSPPFGYALFYVKGLNLEGVTLSHIFRGVVPFMIIQVVGLVIFTCFPQVCTWLPYLMIK
jgi:tripartite ATP-independent transporter DctM subunit